jgi:hypothetical protein
MVPANQHKSTIDYLRALAIEGFIPRNIDTP